MDIGRLNRIMEILHTQVNEAGRQIAAPAQPVQSRSSPAFLPPGNGMQVLRRRVRERLKRLDPADPQLARKSKRVFLETVLAWEFGDALMLDRSFDDLVSQVQQAISSQPELDGQLAELLTNMPAEND